MQISTPVEGFTGRVAGVDFVDGRGETDNESAIAYFQRQGYTVEGGSDDDGPENPEPAEIELLGNELKDPDDGAHRDAADPRNDLIPVGGVKGDGEIVAGKAKGKRVRRGSPEAVDPALAPEPGSVGAPVQESGDASVQSANPSAPNPPEAVVETPAPTRIDGSPVDGEQTPAEQSAEQSAEQGQTDTGKAES